MAKDMEQELFDYCKQLEAECSNAFLYDVDLDKWDGKRLAMYAHGPLHGLYRENSPILWKYLEQEVNTKELLELLRRYIKNCRISFEEDFRREYGMVQMLPAVLERCKREEKLELKSLQEANILQWMNSYNALILEELERESDSVKLRFLELYIKYYYYRKSNDDSSRKAEIDKIYAPILGDNANYRKWNLIPVSDCRELLVLDGPRLYDSSINKTIFLYTPKSIVVVLDELICKKYIGECSFLGACIADGRIELEYLQEAIEFGRVFALNIENLPSVTKLYSEKYCSYEDQLWVRCENNDLTFEELLSGIDDVDVIKTQMVHLQYTKIDADYNISHLDHEYIFYTREEYKNRQISMNQKGQAHKRRKTFKIDNARIPFDYPCKVFHRAESGNIEECDVPFIYFVINAYFRHKDLLEEYFAGILKKDG